MSILFKAFKCKKCNTINSKIESKTEYYKSEGEIIAEATSKSVYCSKCNQLLYKNDKDPLQCSRTTEEYLSPDAIIID